MQIAKLQIDRFGAWSDLVLGPLSSGVNVYWGQERPHRAALIEFVRGMLFGFGDTTRADRLSPGARDLGGSVALNVPSGLLIVHRHDSGEHRERLIVEGDHGPLLNASRLESLIDGVQPTVFDRVFVADFHQRPDTSGLIDAAVQQGLPVIGGHGDASRLEPLRQRLDQHRRLLSELATGDLSLSGLLERRRRLRLEIEAIEATTQQRTDRDNQRRRELQIELVELQQHVDQLQTELRRLDAELETRRDERQRKAGEIERMRFDRQQHVIDQRQRLAEADAQLERWRQVLRDVELRRERLQADHEVDRLSDQGPADPRQALRQLEAQVEQLHASVLQPATADDPSSCVCQQIRPQLAATLQAMREGIYHLCNQLNLWEASARRSETTSEWSQMRRCEAELRQAIQGLTLRRQRWAAELAALAPAGHALHDSHADLCRCTGHPDPTDWDETIDAPVSGLDEELLSVLDAELERLEDQRHELLTHIDEVETKLGEMRARLENDSDHDSDDPLLQGLHAKQAELQRIERQICDGEKCRDTHSSMAQMENEIRSLEAASEPGQILRQAGDLLRRMSLDDLQRVVVTPERNVWVLHRNGTRLSLTDLKAGQQDQVHLSLCLAIVAALGRRGTHLPLLLHDVLLRHDGPRADAMAAVLHDFARGGHQVLLLLGSGAAAQPFRARSAPVRQLPNPREIPLGFVATHSETISDQQRQELNHQLNAIAEEGAQSSPVASGSAFNAEEFPGELTDRVRVARPHEPELAEQPKGSEFFLQESSPIHEAPSVDAATAERLRRIGVLYVRDLLRVDIDDAAHRLRHAGITAAMLRNWRAEALLVCRIPRLRPYDARILVACGVTTPQQLNRLDIPELRRRVERFSATSTGQVLLRSGNRDELKRLIDWIQATRRQPSPGSQRNGRHHPSTHDAVLLKMDSLNETLRFHLAKSDPVERAPSIGPKTAERLARLGICTVDDLLNADPDETARRLRNRRIQPKTVRQWQQQAILVCRIPELRGHDAQILVACGIQDPQRLASADATELWRRVQPLVASPEGKRILRGSTTPDLPEIRAWIAFAAQARPLRAA